MRATDLRTLPFFSHLPIEEVEWILTNATVKELPEGQYLVEEGQAVTYFHIVVDGRLQLTRSANGALVSVGLQYPGNYGGVVPLLSGEVSPFGVEAAIDSRLMLMDKGLFQNFMVDCPVAAQDVMTDVPISVEDTEDSEELPVDYLTSLGKLTASLLHELSLPSRAAQLATESLITLMPRLHMASFELDTVGLSIEQLEDLLAFEERVYASVSSKPLLSPDEHGALEREVSVWLSTRNIENGEDAALTFVSIGITPADLSQLEQELPPGSLVPAVTWLALSLEAARLLDEARLGTSRACSLVNAVQMYSYLDQPDREPVDAHEWLEATLKMLRYKLRNIRIVRKFTDELPVVMANGTQLGQVWMNLIDNAIDAMGGEGILTLVTIVEPNTLTVEVQDNGPGIRPEHIERIFEPFYTTKEVGQGTGLGLDMTYRIIKQHDGDINVQSKPGMTRFIVTLPRA